MSYKRYTREFKEKLLRELGKGETVAAVARRYAVSRQLIYEWQMKQRDGALDDSQPKREQQLVRQIGELERKVGQLTMENDFLKKTLRRLEQTYPRNEDSKGERSGSGKSRIA
jgi:transposase-like protein